MAQRMNQQRPLDRLKDNFKREHQKEARKACPLGCFGESVKDDSLTLTDNTPPFKSNRLFVLQQIETINRENKIPEQCIRDRGQVALWLLIHGKLNYMQVLFFTQLKPIEFVDAYHTNNETCNPIAKGWFLREHLDYIKREIILPHEFIEQFENEKYRNKVVYFLHKIGFAYITNSSLKASYKLYKEMYSKPDTPAKVSLPPYVTRELKRLDRLSFNNILPSKRKNKKSKVQKKAESSIDKTWLEITKYLSEDNITQNIQVA